MIRVRLELLPGGDEKRARLLGELHVWNDRDEGEGYADYKGTLTHEGKDVCMLQVLQHERARGPWYLVLRALIAALQHKEEPCPQCRGQNGQHKMDCSRRGHG